MGRYIVPADLVKYGVNESDVSETWIVQAEATIDKRIGKSGNTTSETITIDKISGNHIDVNQRKINGPIQSISAMSIDDQAVEVNDMVIYEDEGYIRLKTGDWSMYGSRAWYTRGMTLQDTADMELRGMLNISITGVFGRADIPPEVEEIAELTVLKKVLTFIGSSSGSGAIIQETIGRYAYKIDPTSAKQLSPGQFIEDRIEQLYTLLGEDMGVEVA